MPAFTPGANSVAVAEKYDPILDAWASLPTMRSPRADHAAAILPDGGVLLLGGWDSRSVSEGESWLRAQSDRSASGSVPHSTESTPLKPAFFRRSTNAFSFMQVVNGPIRQELSMNAGTSVLGPGNRANATTGHALRVLLLAAPVNCTANSTVLMRT